MTVSEWVSKTTPAAIRVEHVYKAYEKPSTFKLRYLFQSDLFHPRRSHRAGVKNPYVLEDITFELKSGDSLGIIGNNGAGKTTLLRLLAQVMLPTRGRIAVRGRVTALLGLGVGFHPELTGRENVLLHCKFMGLNGEKAEERLREIIEFAELDEFMDVPFKKYSSGMMARLGFATSIHVDPEIVLIDEILAVGDQNFQQKSFDALRRFAARGTLVFVSHNLEAVRSICERAIWLEDGQVRADGPVEEVITAYVLAQQPAPPAPEPPPEEPPPEKAADFVIHSNDPAFEIRSVATVDTGGQPCSVFGTPDTICVRCRLTAERSYGDVRIVVGILDMETGVVLTACDNGLAERPDLFHGQTILEARFPQITLRPRQYGIAVAVLNKRGELLVLWQDMAARFRVEGRPSNPELHYQAPQTDLIFWPNAHLFYLETDVDTGGQTGE
jgi:ABC-type polysaccharide/polyol phosphate transport system ATPase subunit